MNTPSGSPRRKDEILRIAAALFSSQGYHGTSMRDIAAQTGILSGSLYAHISSKQDLLYEIADGAFERTIERIKPLSRGPLSARERIRAYIRIQLSLWADLPDETRVFNYEWRALDPQRQLDMISKRDQIEGVLRDILEDGVRAGELHLSDTKFARLIILSSINWFHEWYKPTGPLTPEEIADHIADLILAATR